MIIDWASACLHDRHKVGVAFSLEHSLVQVVEVPSFHTRLPFVALRITVHIPGKPSIFHVD